MAKVVIHIFHDDENSLAAGSHVAQRVRQVAAENNTELEVYIFGAAQAALTDTTGDAKRADYNNQIDELTRAGVRVSACLNAARAAGTETTLTDRGITLEYARDAYVRYALEGATVINF